MDFVLSKRLNARVIEFNFKSIFIHFLFEPMTNFVMDFHRQADEFKGQVVASGVSYEWHRIFLRRSIAVHEFFMNTLTGTRKRIRTVHSCIRGLYSWMVFHCYCHESFDVFRTGFTTTVHEFSRILEYSNTRAVHSRIRGLYSWTVFHNYHPRRSLHTLNASHPAYFAVSPNSASMRTS